MWHNIIMACQSNHWASWARSKPKHDLQYVAWPPPFFAHIIPVLTNLPVLTTFATRLLQDSLAVAKSKLSDLWKSNKLIIQYSDAPGPAKVTGLTSYRQGWLWFLNLLSGHYTSLSLIRLTDPGKNLNCICLNMLVCKLHGFNSSEKIYIYICSWHDIKSKISW